MAFQIPKSNHPWRQYADREPDPEAAPKKKVRPVKDFLGEMVESWNTVEIVTTAYGKYGRFHLTELSSVKQAAWISNLLRKIYGQTQSY
jgi:hypothetical protein